MAFTVFSRLTTQWIYRPDGRIQGLNYQALKTVMELSDIVDQKDCFLRIRTMERAALELGVKDE